jgi:hypothetical protein
MEAEPSGPADLGGKTFAQIQAEEEAKAKKAAKLAAKQAAATKPPPQQQQQQRPLPANGGNVSAAATAAGPSRPVQQAQQAEARSVAAQTQQQQQQQQPAAVVGTQAGASVAAKPGVEQLSDELTALKQTLNPLIAGMLSTQVGGWAAGHLQRVDNREQATRSSGCCVCCCWPALSVRSIATVATHPPAPHRRWTRRCVLRQRCGTTCPASTTT